MDSKYSYLFSEKAETDLNDIIRYIAITLSNPAAASDFIDRLLAVIDDACLFPQSGMLSETEFIPDMGIRKKPAGNYIVYYLPDETNNTITILRILYSRRNLSEIMAEISAY